MSNAHAIQWTYSWRQTLKVAASFWALCLFLVATEAWFGANTFAAVCFLMSVPILVGLLIWANRHLLPFLKRGMLGVLALSLYFLVSSAVIVFLGLFAGAYLKRLMLGV